MRSCPGSCCLMQMLRTSFSLQRHRRCSSLRSTRVIPQGYGRGETHFKIQLLVPINSKIYSLFPQHFLFPTSADLGREGKEDQAKHVGEAEGTQFISLLTHCGAELRSSTLPPSAVAKGWEDNTETRVVSESR